MRREMGDIAQPPECDRGPELFFQSRHFPATPVVNRGYRWCLPHARPPPPFEAYHVRKFAVDDRGARAFLRLLHGVDADKDGGAFPRDDLDAGVDTLSIVVTDDNGISATASLPLVISAAYPDSDDDGDAYGSIGDRVDCDDHQRDTYPGATELHDGADNDCDGIIDEGTEGFDDDDGDGFAEVNGDCADTLREVNPAALELCNGLDDDCDGRFDAADQCTAVSSRPVVVGHPQPSENACVEGQSIRITAKVFDADGDALVHAWASSEPNPIAGFDNPTAATFNYTCPNLAAE